MAGQVEDGPGVDIDVQLDHSTVNVNFKEFSSELHGISRYEWSVGTHPGRDDVLSFSSYGVIPLESGTDEIGEINMK